MDIKHDYCNAYANWSPKTEAETFTKMFSENKITLEQAKRDILMNDGELANLICEKFVPPGIAIKMQRLRQRTFETFKALISNPALREEMASSRPCIYCQKIFPIKNCRKDQRVCGQRACQLRRRAEYHHREIAETNVIQSGSETQRCGRYETNL